MKNTKSRFLNYFLLILCALIPFMSIGQGDGYAKEKTERAEKRTKKRADQEVNSSVDQEVDKTINKIKGLFKTKKKKEYPHEVERDEQDEDEAEQNEATHDQQTIDALALYGLKSMQVEKSCRFDRLYDYSTYEKGNWNKNESNLKVMAPSTAVVSYLGINAEDKGRKGISYLTMS